MTLQVATLNQIHPTQCPVLLRVRDDFAAWNWGYHKGYIRYNLCGILFYEHQLVVAYGNNCEPSSKAIHAHHKDENRTHNDFSNLEMLPHSEHAKVHGALAAAAKNVVACDNCGKPTPRALSKVNEQKYNFCSRSCYIESANEGGKLWLETKRAEIITITCDQCGKVFERNEAHALRSENTFCSQACAKKSLRKHERPSAAELTELLILHNYKTTKVSQILNVPDGTFRDWLNAYGIKYRKKDLRASGEDRTHDIRVGNATFCH